MLGMFEDPKEEGAFTNQNGTSADADAGLPLVQTY